MKHIEIDSEFSLRIIVLTKQEHMLEFALSAATDRTLEREKNYVDYTNILEAMLAELFKDSKDVWFGEGCLYGLLSYVIHGKSIEAIQEFLPKVDEVVGMWKFTYNIDRMKY